MKRLIPALALASVTAISWAQLPGLPFDAPGGADLAGQFQDALSSFANPGSAPGPETLITAFNNIDDAINAFYSGEGYRGDGMQGAGLAALNPDGTEDGNVTQGFNNGNPAFQGLFVKLSDGTPASPLADLYVMGSDMVYTLLLPPYQLMDAPAEMLVSAGEPLTRPLYDGIEATTFSLELNYDEAALPSFGGGIPGQGGLPQ